MEKAYHASTKHKKGGMAVLILRQRVLLKIRSGGETFHNYRRASISGRQNNYEYACTNNGVSKYTKQQITHISCPTAVYPKNV